MAHEGKEFFLDKMMRAFSGSKRGDSENLNVEVRDRGMSDHFTRIVLPVGW